MKPIARALLADVRNAKIRVVARTSGTFYGQALSAGHIYRVAGDGTAGFAGDGGPALRAELNSPACLLATSAGALICDNSRLRFITG